MQSLKPGFHYPSSRAELTARELGCIFWHPSWRPELTGVKKCRQLGPWTRAVNSGSGNRALVELTTIYTNSSQQETNQSHIDTFLISLPCLSLTLTCMSPSSFCPSFTFVLPLNVHFIWEGSPGTPLIHTGSYIRQMNRVNSRSDFVMMTVP